MKLHGSLLVIVCCLVVELVNISQKRYMIFNLPLFSRITGLTAQGLLFLLYPLLGHLTDVYLTRYRSLKLSYGLIIFGFCVAIVYIAIDIALLIYEDNDRKTGTAVLLIGSIVYIAGIGLFQANSIQFGLDQLLEAPTPKLIAFIHWYYWAQNISQLIVFYSFTSDFALFSNYRVNQILSGKLKEILNIALCILSIIVVTAVLIKFYTAKKHFYIQKPGLNPFKNMYKVLKYSWNHKVPEHRSAFTYWEEDIPRRIDLGKNKYGGPFTNEEVEDTKIFLRILPLLLCLFGCHLAGDGYSAPEQLQRTSCPSLPVLLLIVFNPLHMSTLVAVVGIPLYRQVIVKVIPRLKSVRMLTKMWIGLYLSLLQVVLYIIVVVNHDTSYWQQHHTFISRQSENHYSPSSQCYIIRTGCNTHDHSNKSCQQ